MSRLLSSLARSLNPADTKIGTEELKALKKENPDFYFKELCEIIAGGSSASGSSSDPGIVMAAAINLKNEVRINWNIRGDPTVGFSDGLRESLKACIIPLTFQAQESARPFLFEIVAILSEADFPQQWPDPLQVLVNDYFKFFIHKADKNDLPGFRVACIAVELMVSILKKFDHMWTTKESLMSLKNVLMCCQQPLLEMAQIVTKLYCEILKNPSHDLEGTMLCVRILVSLLKAIHILHTVDLPEYFEDHLGVLVEILSSVIIIPSKDLPGERVSTTEPRLMDQTKEEALKTLTEYASRYGTEFEPYIIDVTRTVLICLTNSSGENVQEDGFVAQAFSYLRFVCDWSVDRQFDMGSQIQNFYRGLAMVILKHTMIQQADLDSLEMDPLLYARQELEGADGLNIRQAVRSLISVLAMSQGGNNQFAVTVKETIDGLTASPGEKRLLTLEAATFLMTAFGAKKALILEGAIELNDQTDPLAFFQTHLLPVLTADIPDSAEAWIIKLAAFHYLIFYRKFIPEPVLINLLPHILKALKSDVTVIHTAASFALEKLLTYKPRETRCYLNTANPQIQLFLGDALQTLLVRTQQDVVQRQANEFLAKCLWRVISRMQLKAADLSALLTQCVDLLRAGIQAVCPGFVRYMFEAIVVVSRLIASQMTNNESQLLQVHTFVLEHMNNLMAADSTDIVTPYCYQTISTLLNGLPRDSDSTKMTNIKPWQDLYKPMCGNLLKKELWLAQIGNITGMIGIIRALIRRQWLFEDPSAYSKWIPSFLDGFNLTINRRGSQQNSKGTTAACGFLNDIWWFSPPSAISTKFVPVIVQILVTFLEQSTVFAHTQADGFVALLCLATLALSQRVKQTPEGSKTGYLVSIPVEEEDVISQIVAMKKESEVASAIKLAASNIQEPLKLRLLMGFTAVILLHPSFRGVSGEVREMLMVVANQLWSGPDALERGEEGGALHAEQVQLTAGSESVNILASGVGEDLNLEVPMLAANKALFDGTINALKA